MQRSVQLEVKQPSQGPQKTHILFSDGKTEADTYKNTVKVTEDVGVRARCKGLETPESQLEA